MNCTSTHRAHSLLLAIAATAATSALYAASVGDTVIWRNSGTAGTKSDHATCSGSDLQFCLSAMDGLPNGSVVKVTSVSLGSRNQTFNSSTDAQSVLIRKPDDSYYWSHDVNGTGSFSSETISAKGTYVPRLSYSFDGKNAQVVVGVTNKLQTIIGGNYLLYPGFKLVDTRNSHNVITHPALDGTDWCPVYEIKAEVVSLGSNPDTSATISGNANLSALSWSSPRTTDGTQWAAINVTGNATLTLDSATNFKMLTIKVAGGRTLTLTGSYPLTAAKIEISGNGKIAAATSALSGALAGCGNVVYAEALPSGVTFDYNWCGTLTLANIAITGPNFNDYGNVASAIKLSGVSGWIHTSHGEYVVPIILEDGNAGFALKLRNGNSPQNNDTNKNRCTVFRKISGDGSFVDTIRTNGTWVADIPRPVFKFFDASGFAGNITLDCASMIICDPSTTYDASLYDMFIKNTTTGVLRIDGSMRPTLATGKTWAFNAYTDEADFDELVLFTAADASLLGGGEMAVTVNGSPLDTAKYIIKPRKGQIVARRRFGLRLRFR